MVDLRISELVPATVAEYADIYPTTQGSVGPGTGVTKKITATQLFSLLISPPAIGTTTPAEGKFTALTSTGLGTFGSASANYTTLAGAAAAAYPGLSALGSDTNIDLKLRSKGIGFINANKLYVGSDGARADINFTMGTKVYFRPTTDFTGGTDPAFFVGGSYTGTTGLTGVILHDFQGTDSIINGGTFFRIYQNVGAAATGGRTTFISSLRYATNTVAGYGSYQVAQAATNRVLASLGGVPGLTSGSVFAANDIATLGMLSGGSISSLVGREVDTTIAARAAAPYHIGLSSVLHRDADATTGTIILHATRGYAQDSAFVIGSAANNFSTVGWRIGLGLGNPVGWAFDDDSRVIAPEVVGADYVATSRPATLASVIDMTEVDLKHSLVISKDASIDLDGNIGGQVTGGVTLQTRDGVYAKTASVATVTPLLPDGGGLYTTGAIPSVVIDAPPGTGVTATAAIATHGAQEINTMSLGGSGYLVNEILTQDGGTRVTPAQVRVTRVDGTGKIRELIVETAGNYSVLPAGERSFTGSADGSGMQASLLYTALTINAGGSGGTVAGSNYPQYPAPVARLVGVGVFRPLVAVVAMTATQANLKLNPAGQVLFPTQGAVVAAGTTQGTATAITSDYVNATAAALQLGVRLPPALVGMRKVVSSASASMLNTLALYPATGEEIFIFGAGSLGVNVSQPILAEEAFALECTVAGRWYGYQIS